MVFLFVNTQEGYSQVLISNSAGSPNSNAMLEIESSDKGVLIPRITTEKRELITATPGLLVFDSDIGSFFLYGKTADGSAGWIDLSTDAGIWTRDNAKGNVFLSNSTFNVGIGTSSPKNRLVIQANNDSDTLLEIRDKNGVPLMVVTPVLTRFNFVKPKKGVSGGFAVGRYATAKDGKTLEDTTSLFLVTADSTRVYTTGSAVTSGGFAVGRYATAKGLPYVEKYFYTDIDSTRVYTGGGSAVTSGGFAVGRYATAKGAPYVEKYFFTDIDSTRVYTGGGSAVTSGGFAVGRYATAKEAPYIKKYFFTDIDSTRVYSQVTAKGLSGGFAVENYAVGVEPVKKFFFTNVDSTTINVKDSTAGLNVINVGSSSEQKFMNITTENSKIGHEAGFLNTPNVSDGIHNSFIGYRAGYSNVSGSSIVCIGNQAGFKNTTDYNVFIGNLAGYNNTIGGSNVFIGNESGLDNTQGAGNMFIGYRAGQKNITGNQNVFMGHLSGRYNTAGTNNLFLGYQTGNKHRHGDYNIYIGTQAGYYDTIGVSNIYIGYRAGRNNTDGSSNIFIGNQAGYNELGSDKLYIDNSNTATPLIWGNFNSNKLGLHGSVCIGDTINGDGTNVLGIVNGTVPTSSITNGILLYSDGASSELVVRDEAGNTTTLSPHNFSLIKKSEPMAWSYYSKNSNTGQTINIDMLRVVRLIEEITGEKIVYIKDKNGKIKNKETDQIELLIETIKNKQSFIDNQNEILERLIKENEQIKNNQRAINKEIEHLKESINSN